MLHTPYYKIGFLTACATTAYINTESLEPSYFNF